MNKKKAIITAIVVVLILAISIGAVALSSSRKVRNTSSLPEPPIYEGEIPLKEGVEIAMTEPIYNFFHAGGIVFDLPGKTIDAVCDHNYLFNREDRNVTFFATTDTARTYKGEDVLILRGRRSDEHNRWHYSLDYTETTVRIIIRENGAIVGYAMVCFWEPTGPSNQSYFNDGALVKAVLFDSSLIGIITEDEVNSRLDRLYEEYVIGEGLFATHTENRIHALEMLTDATKD